MIAVGVAITSYIEQATPIGKPGMTEDEKFEFLMVERENSDYKTLSGILIGVGFLILLRSEERRVGKECRSRWSPYH